MTFSFIQSNKYNTIKEHVSTPVPAVDNRHYTNIHVQVMSSLLVSFKKQRVFRKKEEEEKNHSSVKAQSRGRYWLVHRRTDVLKQGSNISVLCFRVTDGVSGVLISPSTMVTGIAEYAHGSCLC